MGELCMRDSGKIAKEIKKEKNAHRDIYFKQDKKFADL